MSNSEIDIEIFSGEKFIILKINIEEVRKDDLGRKEHTHDERYDNIGDGNYEE